MQDPGYAEETVQENKYLILCFLFYYYLQLKIQDTGYAKETIQENKCLILRFLFYYYLKLKIQDTGYAEETIQENKCILLWFCVLFSIFNLRWNTAQANHICLKSFVQSFGAKWKIYQSNEVKAPNYQIDICRFVLILFSFLIKQITSNLNRL